MYLYDLLGVAKDASIFEIRVAYLEKISRIPKDGFRGWLCAALNVAMPYHLAYEILSNTQKRAEYDWDPTAEDNLWIPLVFM